MCNPAQKHYTNSKLHLCLPFTHGRGLQAMAEQKYVMAWKIV